MKNRFEVICRADSADVWIYDAIGNDGWGGISAKTFAEELEKSKGAKTLNVYINSPGGDVFDGLAMLNNLKRHSAKKNVRIDGLAASAASFLAMVGDTIEMGTGSHMMIHNPYTAMVGDAAAMRHSADLLDKITGEIVDIYAKRTKNEPAKIVQMLEETTWMNPQEAVALRFADKAIETAPVSNCFDLSRFKFRNTPATLQTTAHNADLRAEIAKHQFYLTASR